MGYLTEVALTSAVIIATGSLAATAAVASDTFGPYTGESPGAESLITPQDLDAPKSIALSDLGDTWLITVRPQHRFGRFDQGQFSFWNENITGAHEYLRILLHADYYPRAKEIVQGRGYVQLTLGPYDFTNEATHVDAQEGTRENGFTTTRDVTSCVKWSAQTSTPDSTGRAVVAYSVRIPKSCVGILTPDRVGVEHERAYCSWAGYSICIRDWQFFDSSLHSPDLRPPIERTVTAKKRTKLAVKQRGNRLVVRVKPRLERKVKLLVKQGGRFRVSKKAATNPRGRAVFKRLTNGRYRVVVKRHAVESTSTDSSGTTTTRTKYTKARATVRLG